MKKQYKIQLPKGKKVTMTNVNFEDGVMTVNVELENRTNFHEAMHNEVCDVFGKINNEFKEVLKANGVTREKIEEMAKEPIKELEKDCPDIWNKMIQEYGEAICGKKVQKYEPKDGEFIHLKWKGIKTLHPYEKEEREAIAIFKEIKNDMLYCYITYLIGEDFKNRPVFIPLFDNNGHKLSNGYTSTFDEIRPATEKEKKLLIDKLAEDGKKWNPERKRIEDVRWRADYEEEFYYVDCFGRVAKEKRTELFRYPKFDSKMRLRRIVDDDSDTQLYNVDNYFKTREAAEKVAEQIRDIFKNSKAE